MSRALSRRTDPATSQEAAEAVQPHLSMLERRVVWALRNLGGSGTSHQIAERSGLDLVTVSPRMRPLVNKGVVREDGELRLPGQSARTLWRLVESDTLNPPEAA